MKPTNAQKLRLQKARIAVAEMSKLPQHQIDGVAKNRVRICGTAVRWDRLTNHNPDGELPSSLMKDSIDELTFKYSDVPLTINHDPSQVIASTGDGTLVLEVRDHGLSWRADLPNCEASRSIAQAVKSKRLHGSSLKYRGRGRTVKRGGRSIQECIVVEEIEDVSIVTQARDSLCWAFVLPTAAEKKRRTLESLVRYRDDAEYRAAVNKEMPRPLSDAQWQRMYSDNEKALAKL